jgi:hypothetical protein
MKSLSLIAVAVISLGALALSGCSSCSPQPTTTQQAAPPPLTCGPGTVAQGNQCVGAVRR